MPRSARVQTFLTEASPAEREELAQELGEPLVITDEDLRRQQEAIRRFLEVPTFSSGSSDVSSDKYAALHKHR
jgi:hypothetical protein